MQTQSCSNVRVYPSVEGKGALMNMYTAVVGHTRGTTAVDRRRERPQRRGLKPKGAETRSSKRNLKSRTLRGQVDVPAEAPC